MNILQANGLSAERVPLSGALGGRFIGDISLPFLGQDAAFESKVRADGFKEIYKWLKQGITGLFIKANRKECLVVLRMSDFIRLLLEVETAKALRQLQFHSAVAEAHLSPWKEG